MKDLESVAFGVAIAGSEVLAECLFNGTLTEQKIDDTSFSCIEVVQKHTGASREEAKSALARACAKIKDRSCN